MKTYIHNQSSYNKVLDLIRNKLNYLPIFNILTTLLIFTTLFIFNTNTFADGTRDYLKITDIDAVDRTVSTNTVAFCLFDNVDGDGKIGTPMATDPKKKFYIRIADPATEVIYLGFQISYDRDATSSGTPDKYFRILAPDGVTIVQGWTVIPRSSGQGYIEDFDEVFNGPIPTYGVGGYNPITIDLNNGNLPSGDYIIEFNNNQSNTVDNINNGYTPTTLFKMIDISVGAENGNTSGITHNLKEGRFYAYIFTMFNFFDRLNFNYDGVNLDYYAYQEKDQVITKLSWDEVVGGGWNILFNSYGAGSSGDLSLDRKSNPPGASSAQDAIPEFKVFFAPPDTIEFPTLDLTPIFNYVDYKIDCQTGLNAFFYTMNRSGTIEILLEFDSPNINGSYDPGTSDRILVFNDVTINTNKTLWDGLDGLGIDRSNDGNTYNVSFKYSIGVINNPMFDVEQIRGGLSVSLYAPDPVALNWDIQRKIYFDDLNVPSHQYFDYNGCLSGCRTYPVNPTNSSATHTGDQIWMNSWWSSYDSLYSYTFVALDKADTIPLDSVYGIAACADGQIAIEGLVGGDDYDITYTFNSISYGPNTYTADTYGEVIIPNLAVGLYTDIEINQGVCVASRKDSVEIDCPHFIYGTVLNDTSGVMNNPLNPHPNNSFQYVDGEGIGVANGEQLYVILNEIQSNNEIKFIAYQAVNADGTYEFADLLINTDYELILTNEDLPSVPSTMFSTFIFPPSTPDQWFFIGEIQNDEFNTIAGHDGNIDGKIVLSNQLTVAQPNADFVNFAISDINTLPIELLNFNAYCHNGQVSIKWETASETNNDFFTIEKSYDAQNWEVTDIVYGAGNSNQINTYSSFDEQNTQIVYYRLTQTDYDGKYVVFTPVSVDVCNEADYNYSVDVYPNPSVNSFNVRINNYQYNNAILNVYNALGQNVYSTEMTHANITIDVAEWERGIYFTRVNIGDEVKMIKLILQ